ncbi:hypothetical protein Tco_1563721 [Tanacetum coccineum]
MNEVKIKKDLEEIETINIELDHRVTKLIAENEHLKQTYKQLYDSIKPVRIQSKEQCANLINQVNLKSVENFDLNASLQEKVLHSKLNANSELKCVKCNGCMLSDNHDLCVLDFIKNVNARAKSKSTKKIGNACPLTRIATTTEVPIRKPTTLDNETSKPVVTLVYSWKPRKSKTNVPVSKSKVLKSVSAKKKEPSQS